MSNTALAGEYPNNWNEFVGQDKAKRQLRIASGAAKLRGKNLGHTLLSSQFAGIGKTSLALLVAKEMDTQVLITTGAMTLADVRVMFTKLEDGDILFIDEIHKVMDSGKKNAEWLLHYLQDGVLLTPFGPEEVARCTVIGATTDVGVLPEPVKERFTVQPELVAYTDVEGQSIAQAMSLKVMVPDGLAPVHAEVAQAVAAAASNRPRWMRRLLEAMRDLALVGEIPRPRTGKYDMDSTLAFTGLTHDGLTPEAQAYLKVLFVDMRAQATGLAVLKERLGQVGRGLSEIEQLLMNKEYVALTKGGRMLTSTGLRRAKALADAA
jgi:Holliday junction DNA helicase RuvB